MVLFIRIKRWLLLGILATVTGLLAYFSAPSMAETTLPTCLNNQGQSTASLSSLALPASESAPHFDVLQQSWIAYRDRFIQSDGRVIDREANDRTVSEGQAYAMLRAVMINDPDTFMRTLTWAENNLVRKDEQGKRTDSLWAWKWGRTSTGAWQTIDGNFASDADIDATTALILAARRWNCPELLDLAQQKLDDLWKLSTAKVKGDRYLLPGGAEVFWKQPDAMILNPSYLAPYAFRLFDQVDNRHNWNGLVNSSYRVLEESADLSLVGLPSDWIVFNPNTQQFQPLAASDSLKSQYGFDAYRVWWRIALDGAWFEEPRAEAYLQQHMTHLKELWQSQQKIPAQISLPGEPLVDYEATSQYAMLYYAFQLTDPTIANQIYQQKLLPQYSNGFWDSDSAYYTQNLAWFGLLPSVAPEPLVQANSHCGSPFGLDSLLSLLRMT